MDQKHIKNMIKRYLEKEPRSFVFLDSIAYQLGEKKASDREIREVVKLVVQIASRYQFPLESLKILDRVTEEYIEENKGIYGLAQNLKDLENRDSLAMARIGGPLQRVRLDNMIDDFLIPRKRYVPSGNVGVSSSAVILDEDSGGYRSVALRALEDG